MGVRESSAYLMEEHRLRLAGALYRMGEVMVMRAQTSIRILVYGLDADLQLTRGKLLRHAGYTVDIAEDQPGYREHLNQHKYQLVFLCHSVPQEEREDCEKLARSKKMTVLALCNAIAPQDLVCQVAELTTA